LQVDFLLGVSFSGAAPVSVQDASGNTQRMATVNRKWHSYRVFRAGDMCGDPNIRAWTVRDMAKKKFSIFKYIGDSVYALILLTQFNEESAQVFDKTAAENMMTDFICMVSTKGKC
jgi:hypothetical protein